MNVTRRRFVGFQFLLFGGLFSKKLRSHLFFMIHPDKDGKMLQEYLHSFYPTRNACVSWMQEGDGLLLSSPGLWGGHSLVMNEVGGAIWEACNGEKNIPAIVGEISSRFDVEEETCMVDILDHLKKLSKCGMITMNRKKEEEHLRW